MTAMWVRIGRSMRCIDAEPYGHPTNKVWRETGTKRRYNEGREIFATEADALRSLRQSLRDVASDASRRAVDITQRLVEMGEE